MVKNVVTLVRVVRLVTGRMALRLKIGPRACSRAGWLGSEQLITMALYTADERIQKCKTCSYFNNTADLQLTTSIKKHVVHNAILLPNTQKCAYSKSYLA